MRRFTGLLVAFLAMIGLVLGVTPAASAAAAPGDIALHNQGDSGAWLDVRMRRPDGSTYEINLIQASTAGEPNYSYAGDEPLSFYQRVGWCSWISVNDGPLTYLPNASQGYWRVVYPGTDFTGTMLVRVKTWNC